MDVLHDRTPRMDEVRLFTRVGGKITDGTATHSPVAPSERAPATIYELSKHDNTNRSAANWCYSDWRASDRCTANWCTPDGCTSDDRRPDHALYALRADLLQGAGEAATGAAAEGSGVADRGRPEEAR